MTLELPGLFPIPQITDPEVQLLVELADGIRPHWGWED